MGKHSGIEEDSQAVAYSSLGSRSTNLDGSKKIYCFNCRKYIGSVNMETNFNGALCEDCRRIENGQDPIPNDIPYRSVYVHGVGDVPESVIFVREPEEDPMIGKLIVAPASRINYMRRVLSTLSQAVTKKKKQPESSKVAKEKKNKRIFADGINVTGDNNGK